MNRAYDNLLLRASSRRVPVGWRTMLHAVRALLAGSVAWFYCSVSAAAGAMTEYQLKANYLFNFVAFTEWPADLGPALSLCIYGPDPFGKDIDKFQGENINGHHVRVSRISTADQLDDCDIVFISSDVINNVHRVLDRTAHKPVLTVADSPGATANGVSINMNMEENKITFEVNMAAVRSSKLEVSFQLLRLAKKVL